MIAVDSNIFVYAHREDSQWHQAADRALTGLAESGAQWVIPWPCVHEFLATTTHPRIFNPPTPIKNRGSPVETSPEARPVTIHLGRPH